MLLVIGCLDKNIFKISYRESEHLFIADVPKRNFID